MTDSKTCSMLIKFIETNCLSLCFRLVPFRSKSQLKPHPDWYLLGVQLKFPNARPRPFCDGSPREGRPQYK